MLDLNIFSDDTVKDEGAIIAFNTGTLFDMHLGQYVIGVDGRWYCNGGFGNYLIIVEAEPNQHKSTLSDSLLMCSLSNYPATRYFCFENEGNKDKDRLLRFNNSLLTGGDNDEYKKRVTLKSDKDCTIEDVDDHVSALCSEIKPHLKKMWMQSPISLNDTPAPILFPTWVSIDSFTNPNTRDNEKKVDGNEVTDSANNMDAMNIGRAKTRYVPKLSRQIGEYGLCVVATVQLGDKKADLGSNPNIPVAGDTPDAKGGKTAKRVGTELIKRSMATLQIMKVGSFVKRADKQVEKMGSVECEYPLGDTPPDDIQTLKVSTSRNKLAGSGVMIDAVISKATGLLPDVTNFHFLRTMKGYNGFAKDSGGRWTLELYPDVTITRKNLREQCLKDYKLARALDITARYVYIRASRGKSYLGLDWSKTLAEVRETAIEKGIDLDMVLESTEIWMPNFPKDSDGNALGAHGRRHYTVVEFLETVTKG